MIVIIQGPSIVFKINTTSAPVVKSFTGRLPAEGGRKIFYRFLALLGFNVSFGTAPVRVCIFRIKLYCVREIRDGFVELIELLIHTSTACIC